MRIYECPDCGNVKEGKDYQYCSNPCDDVAMYEVLSWGKSGPSQQCEALNKVKKDVKNALNLHAQLIESAIAEK